MFCKEYLVSKTPATRDAAQAACEAKGGNLVTMPSDEEVEKVAQLMDDTTFYWIGGSCQGDCQILPTYITL